MDPYHRIETSATSMLVVGQLIGIHYFLNKMRAEFNFLLPFNGYGISIKDRDNKYHAIAGFIVAIYIATQLLYMLQGHNIFFYQTKPELWSILIDIFNQAVNLFNFFLLSTILWICINIYWAIRQISSKQCPNLIYVDLFNIDRAGGLSRIRKFILDVSIFYFVVMIFTILSYVTPFWILSYENIFIITLLFVGAGFFISSLSALDSILKDKIESELIANTQEYKAQKDKLKSILSGDKSAETEQELNSILILLNLFSNERSWLLSLEASIWDITTLGTFTVTLLASLMTYVLKLQEFWQTIHYSYGVIIKPL